ncbi:MAG TPA: hypothetical protein VJB06_00635 [archaeon]|nr:hypothetical protein [archaeon]
MWWWFKKTKGKPSDDKRWASLAASLKLSFAQVRHDINHLTTSDNLHHQNLHQLSERIHLLEKRVDSLLLTINLSQPSYNLPASLPEAPSPPQHNQQAQAFHIIENLTDVQKSILMTLSQITKELPSGWLSLKELSSEIYPNKRYNDVRTMMSEYTDKLLEFGLINKKRKGREVVISLTEKTKHLEPVQKQPVKHQVKKEKKEEKTP